MFRQYYAIGLSYCLILAAIFSFSYSMNSIAACGGGPLIYICDTSLPNPDLIGLQLLNDDNDLILNVLPGAAIDTSGVPSDAIETGDGMNVINVNMGTLTSGSDRDCIDTASGNNAGIEVNVTNSNFTSCFSCIDTANGPDNINVTGSTLNSTGNGDSIRSGNNNDVVIVNNSDLFAGPTGHGIDTGGDDDQITVNDSLVEGIDAGSGENTVHVDNSDILGLLNDAISTSSTFNNTITVYHSTLSGFDGIDTSDGDQTIRVSNTTVTAQNNGMDLGNNGTNMVDVTDSIFSCQSSCIDTKAGNDTINVIRSSLNAMSLDGIRTGLGDDIIYVEDSEILAGDNPDDAGIRVFGGTNEITVVNSLIDKIRAGNNEDTITLGTASDIQGLIDCGAGFDTLIFAMEVPFDQAATISAEIDSKDPNGDTITIDGLLYEWVNCDQLVANLQVPKQVPTLSEWGLIATAVVLGFIGFIVIRRRQTFA